MSAPQSFPRIAAQIERTKLFESFLKVGLSVAIFPNSGSCHPTRTSLAFGVFVFTSGSLLFFHTNTHRALIIFSGFIPRLLHNDITLFSTQDCHSFCIAFSKRALSSLLSLRKETSTRLLAAFVLAT